MGTFKKYRPYYACNAVRFSSYGPGSYASSVYKWGGITRVPNFKAVNGTEYGWLVNLNSRDDGLNSNTNVTTASGQTFDSVKQHTFLMGNYEHFTYLDPFATADVLSEYSIDDYEINPIGVTYVTRARFVARDVNKILYSMSIFNNNVDTYDQNISTLWDPTNNEYYSYDSTTQTYTHITEEPADWSTNYTDYYILHEAEDITVTCIKFRNYMRASTYADRGYSSPDANEQGNTNVLALYCSYFLDQPVTIYPGDSYLLSLSFESSQF